MRILQVFADRGAENRALSSYGDVYRFTKNAYANEDSQVVQCDANQLPIAPDATFDIGWFHPPCGGASPMSDTGNGSRESWPDLIPLSRDIAQQHCDEWVIENKPRDSLNETVVLDGHMFELGIEYKRAFETSFDVEQPRQQNRLSETGPFTYSEKPHGWWCSVKGTDTSFRKEHVAKNTIPAAYIRYIMRHYYDATDSEKRPDYSDYDKEMDAKRSKQVNAELTHFKND